LGLFFEDINRAADGGVYAEMVADRSFDFQKPMTAWQTWQSQWLKDGILWSLTSLRLMTLIQIHGYYLGTKNVVVLTSTWCFDSHKISSQVADRIK
jgi:hypothetical protein